MNSPYIFLFVLAMFTLFVLFFPKLGVIASLNARNAPRMLPIHDNSGHANTDLHIRKVKALFAVQLVIAAGFLALIVTGNVKRSLEETVENLEKKFDNLEKKVDNLENKVDNLENKVDNIIKTVEHLAILVNAIAKHLGMTVAAAEGNNAAQPTTTSSS